MTVCVTRKGDPRHDKQSSVHDGEAFSSVLPASYSPPVPTPIKPPGANIYPNGHA
jgi:hypothetical protein